MKRISHRQAFTIALAAILASVVSVSFRDTASHESTQAGRAFERTRTRDVPFRMTVSGQELTDPIAVLRSLSKIPESDRLPSEMRLAGTWGRHDFPAARDWVLAGTTASRNDLLTALGRGAVTVRPLEAMALADRLATEQERISFFTTMVQTWASSDPAAATEWVAACDLVEKPSIQTALVTQLAQEDPLHAATYVAVSMEPGSAQDQAALTVAARWAALDPAAANEWALSLPESDLQQRVLAAVTSLSPP